MSLCSQEVMKGADRLFSLCPSWDHYCVFVPRRETADTYLVPPVILAPPRHACPASSEAATAAPAPPAGATAAAPSTTAVPIETFGVHRGNLRLILNRMGRVLLFNLFFCRSRFSRSVVHELSVPVLDDRALGLPEPVCFVLSC